MASTSEISLVIKNIKRVLTDEEIKEIASSCKGLRSINTREEETREKYVANYKKFYGIYKRTIKAVEELTDDLKNSFPGTKTQVRELVILGIRTKQQDLGVTRYLLNPVKYSFIKTIVNWINNPSALKTKSTYRPRTKVEKDTEIKKKDANHESGSQSEIKIVSKPKIIPKPKQKIIAEKPEMNVVIIDKKALKDTWKISFNIENNSSYPLQNLEIRIYDEKDDSIHVSSVSGDLIEVANGIIYIRFIPASMTGEFYTAKFVFTVSEVENIQDGLTFSIKQDYPAKTKIVTIIFDF
ncbi:MAG: hypothetical protein GPJ51_08585 [Candidatus Heimdallarchaeota archaeon]|nr:hypothetical protein [Candidatus Heimdallarchaeota archaeon]